MTDKLPYKTMDRIYELLERDTNFEQIGREVGVNSKTISFCSGLKEILDSHPRVTPTFASKTIAHMSEKVELHQAIYHHEENGTFEGFEFDGWNKYANALIWLHDKCCNNSEFTNSSPNPLIYLGILLSSAGENRSHRLDKLSVELSKLNQEIDKYWRYSDSWRNFEYGIGTLSHRHLTSNENLEELKTVKLLNFVGNKPMENLQAYQKTPLGIELTDHLMNTNFSN